MPHHQPLEWDIGADLMNHPEMFSLDGNQEQGFYPSNETTCDEYDWTFGLSALQEPKITSTMTPAESSLIYTLPNTVSEPQFQSTPPSLLVLETSPTHTPQSVSSPSTSILSSPTNANTNTDTDLVSRRRQQNRIAQIAFRQRNKKVVEELKAQLSHSAQLNQALGSAVYEALNLLPGIMFAVGQEACTKGGESGGRGGREFLRAEVKRLERCLANAVRLMG